MKGQRGIGTLILIIILMAMASALTLGVGYWTGTLNKGVTVVKSEKLEVANIAIEELSGYGRCFKILVKNTGSNDVKLEYVVFNGTITPYASKMQDTLITYNFLAGEYLIMPYNSQAEIYLPYKTIQKSTVEIRFHTVAGNDFSTIVTFAA